jgi:pimeloyl-ACP methyl ester carboxylesterase
VDAQRSNVLLTDGRVIEVAIVGPKDGTPLVFHHGTPGSVFLYEPFMEAAEVRGLRYVTYSRPGYGNSTRQPDRTVANCASDTVQIANRLGLSRFFTIGWSGGGPHALACSALLSDRVIAAASVAGIAPRDSPDLNYLAGMGEENIEEFNAAIAGPNELQSYLERVAPTFAQVTGNQIIAALGDVVGNVDKRTLTGELGTFLADNTRAAFKNGFWGWFDDDLAFVRNWGFDIARITVPVTVWQGAQDRMVPFSHGQWLAAHIPGVRAFLLPEHGHLSLAVDSFSRILDDLIARGKQ